MPKVESFTCKEVQRLDKFLSDTLDVSRNQIANLIKSEAIKVDARICSKPGLKLKIEQTIEVTYPEVQTTAPLDIDFDVEILFEDEDILVINKPSGLTVHPAPSVKEATLVDWLKHHNISLSTISGEERHGIVHRLDKGTSGVMVIAKNNEAHTFLSEQLQDKSMGRYYLAVVEPPLKDEFTYIDAPIGRSPHNRLKMSVNPNGKSAQTLFRSLAYSVDEKYQLLTCKLFTGRTHQIRVHLESKSRRILGEHLYAIKSKEDKISRILLHAYMLYFTHPRSKKVVKFVATLDDITTNYYHTFFDKDEIYEKIKPEHFDTYFSNFTPEQLCEDTST